MLLELAHGEFRDGPVAASRFQKLTRPVRELNLPREWSSLAMQILRPAAQTTDFSRWEIQPGRPMLAATAPSVSCIQGGVLILLGVRRHMIRPDGI